MSMDFLNFIEAYHNCDSIGVEYGYKKQVPVWVSLGQTKYVDIHFGHQETLLKKFPYSRLQELHLNQFVRHFVQPRFHAQAMDENLEFGNHYFSMFPMPKTLQSFVIQSNYVGVSLRCKAFVKAFFLT